MGNVGPPLAGRSAGLKEYLKRGFLYKWNLLLFAGGVGAAILSPFPDALLPLVAAAEAIYLGGLVSIPKFRRAIDADIYQESRAPQPAHAGGPTLNDIIGGLDVAQRRRFEAVRARCLEMRTISSGVRGRAGATQQPGEDLSTPALDKLLWVFLRLLVSQQALGHFLQNTNVDEIRKRLDESKAKLEKLQGGGEERLIRSLTDSIAAQELRLQNYERAQSNLEFVRIELDRIEAKIQVLAESSVNRQDPDFLTRQIDSVTESMQSTEKAISELQQITGLVDEMQEPPAILEGDYRRIVQ